MVRPKELPGQRGRHSRKRLILPVFIGLIMVMSIFGYIIGQDSSGTQQDAGGKTFGQFTFQQTAAGWTTTVDGRELSFRYLPDELSDVRLGASTSDILRREKVYLTRDPTKDYGLGERDFYLNLRPILNIQLACTTDVAECSNLPLKTCIDGNALVAIVQLEAADRNEVLTEDHCVIIRGDGVYITKAIDKLVYSYYAIG